MSKILRAIYYTSDRSVPLFRIEETTNLATDLGFNDLDKYLLADWLDMEFDRTVTTPHSHWSTVKDVILSYE